MIKKKTTKKFPKEIKKKNKKIKKEIEREIVHNRLKGHFPFSLLLLSVCLQFYFFFIRRNPISTFQFFPRQKLSVTFAK